MLAIQSTLKVTPSVIHLVAAALLAGQDGFQLTDVFPLLGPIREAFPALKEIGQVPAELADLDPGEAALVAETLAAAIEKDFAPGHAREIASATLELVPGLARLVAAIKAARNAGEGAPA